MGTKANYGVSGGTGSIAMPTPGIGPSVNLAGVSSSSSDVQVSVAPQQVPTGSGSFVSVIGRQVAGVGTYRAVANLRSNGAVSLTIVRVDGAGQATVVPAAMVSGLTYAAGDKLNIRMQATGTSPTVLRAKVWKDGQAEPGWQLSGSDGAGAHAGCRIHRVDELPGGERHCGDHEPVRHPAGLRHHWCCAGGGGPAAGCSPGEPAPERRRPAREPAGLAVEERAGSEGPHAWVAAVCCRDLASPDQVTCPLRWNRPAMSRSACFRPDALSLALPGGQAAVVFHGLPRGSAECP